MKVKEEVFDRNHKGELTASPHCLGKHYPELELPDDIEVVAEGAFRAIGITIDRLIVPASVRRIKAAAFYGCGIKELEIEAGDVSMAIDGQSFAYNLLEELVLPQRVWYVGKGSFSHCSKLKRLIKADGLKTIYTSAFEETAIDSLDFEKFAPLITEIKEKAFCNCGLVSLRMPTPVGYSPIKIADNAFIGNVVKEVKARPDTFSESDLENLEGLEKAIKIIK